MKRTLLFVLALIAVGCVDAEQSETPSEGSEQVNSLSTMSPQERSALARRIAEEIVASRSQSGLGPPSLPSAWSSSASCVDMTPESSLEHLRNCAEQGDAVAQTALGIMYAEGDGVPVDHVLAYMWYNLAAAQGNETGQSFKDLIEKVMTREQITRAQRLSREWLEAHPPGGN